MAWIAGPLAEISVAWRRIEGEVEVRQKELVRVRVGAAARDFCALADDFLLAFDLSEEKLYGDERVFLIVPATAAGEALEMPVFGVSIDAEIKAARLVPEAEIVGDDVNYTALKLINKGNGAVICTKTFVAGVSAPAFEVSDFGPVDEQAAKVAAGKGVFLIKENVGAGMAMPRMLLVVEWNMR